MNSNFIYIILCIRGGLKKKCGIFRPLRWGASESQGGERNLSHPCLANIKFGKAGEVDQLPKLSRGLPHGSFPRYSSWLSTTQNLELRNIMSVRTPPIWKNKLLLNEYLFLCILRAYFLVWKWCWPPPPPPYKVWEKLSCKGIFHSFQNSPTPLA